MKETFFSLAYFLSSENGSVFAGPGPCGCNCTVQLCSLQGHSCLYQCWVAKPVRASRNLSVDNSEITHWGGLSVGDARVIGIELQGWVSILVIYCCVINHLKVKVFFNCCSTTVVPISPPFLSLSLPTPTSHTPSSPCTPLF